MCYISDIVHEAWRVHSAYCAYAHIRVRVRDASSSSSDVGCVQIQWWERRVLQKRQVVVNNAYNGLDKLALVVLSSLLTCSCR